MADNKIYFDSNDWDSIRDTIEKINEIGELQAGKTEDGEDIIFDVCKDDEGNDCLVTHVHQKNGWWRKNVYNPSDYSIEELYQKGV